MKSPAGRSWRGSSRGLTATSADAFCDGRVVGPSEDVVQGVDGLALEVESDVAVDAGGDADVGVAEEFLDHDKDNALLQEQRRGRVAEVVEADTPELRPVEEAAEAAGEVGRVEGAAGRGGENEAAVLPSHPGLSPLPVLPFYVLFEGVEAFGREGDTAFGRPGLGGQMREAAGAGALERAADAGRSGGEVEVFPVEAEEFACAEPGAQCEYVQRVEPVGPGRVEELPSLCRSERTETPGLVRGGLDVAGQLVFADGVFQCRLEHRVHVRHGQSGWGLPAFVDIS